MAEISWSFEAKDDLKLIHEYISSDSEFYVNRMIEKIIAHVWSLESQPHLGRVVPEFENKVI